MMMNEIRFTGAAGRAFNNPDTNESHAFFDGARAILSALEEIPTSERDRMLAAKNQQHIVAVLAAGEQYRRDRKLREAQLIMDCCYFDKREARAFIFDVPVMHDDGHAFDLDGNPLDDEQFRPLPGVSNPGYPNCVIFHTENDKQISLKEYNSLSPEEREDYSRYRFLYAKTALGKPVLKVNSFDREIVETMIKQDILIGDPINDRYEAVLKSGKDDPLYSYFWTINEALLITRGRNIEMIPMYQSSPSDGQIATD